MYVLVINTVDVSCDHTIQLAYVVHHGVTDHGNALPPPMQETWRYSYPLHTNTVPAWVVPTLSTCGPATVFVVWYLIWRPGRWEMHNLILGLMASVFACALITNLIKITVCPFPFPAASDAVAHLAECCVHSALQHYKFFACDAHGLLVAAGADGFSQHFCDTLCSFFLIVFFIEFACL